MVVYRKTKMEPNTISRFLNTLQQADIMQDISKNQTWFFSAD